MQAMPIGLSLPPSSLSPMNMFTPTSGATPKASSSGSGSSSSAGTGLASTTTGTTFLSLLVDELQNQDPSAPMDSTAMVGQMISLNQLDQLVSINSELGTSTTAKAKNALTAASSLTAAPAVASSNNQSSSALIAAKNALLNSSSLSSSMNAASLAASNPNATLDLSSFTNQIGGK